MEFLAAGVLGGAATALFGWAGWRSAGRRAPQGPRPVGPVVLTVALREPADPLPLAPPARSGASERAVSDLKALARAVEAARRV
jgi:hypothetical protein